LREQINLKHHAGSPDRFDRVGTTGQANERELRLGQGATYNIAASDSGSSLPATRACDLSDQHFVWQWVEKPYWQVFAGETLSQTERPVDPSSPTR
jgi:IS5 family transposase